MVYLSDHISIQADRIGCTISTYIIASCFLIYLMAIRILHAPNSVEEINVAEQLINYYCQSVPLKHGRSIKLFSFHAYCLSCEGSETLWWAGSYFCICPRIICSLCPEEGSWKET
jgi:hypothetical protein